MVEGQSSLCPTSQLQDLLALAVRRSVHQVSQQRWAMILSFSARRWRRPLSPRALLATHSPIPRRRKLSDVWPRWRRDCEDPSFFLPQSSFKILRVDEVASSNSRSKTCSKQWFKQYSKQWFKQSIVQTILQTMIQTMVQTMVETIPQTMVQTMIQTML